MAPLLECHMAKIEVYNCTENTKAQVARLLTMPNWSVTWRRFTVFARNFRTGTPWIARQVESRTRASTNVRLLDRTLWQGHADHVRLSQPEALVLPKAFT